MAKPTPQGGIADHLKRTVTPRRRRNGDLRTREYFTEHEVERLIAAAKPNRHGQRDATIVLVAYRHGLRAAEVALGSGRQNRDLARPPRRGGHAQHPSHPRR